MLGLFTGMILQVAQVRTHYRWLSFGSLGQDSFWMGFCRQLRLGLIISGVLQVARLGLIIPGSCRYLKLGLIIGEILQITQLRFGFIINGVLQAVQVRTHFDCGPASCLGRTHCRWGLAGMMGSLRGGILQVAEVRTHHRAEALQVGQEQDSLQKGYQGSRGFGITGGVSIRQVNYVAYCVDSLQVGRVRNYYRCRVVQRNIDSQGD